MKWRTCKGFCGFDGRSFDMEKRWDLVRYNFWNTISQARRAPIQFRYSLAGRLARVVCWLRREKWYVADAWHGVPGNRVAELRQQIRHEFLVRMNFSDEDDKEAFEKVNRLCDELAQRAGETWGHVWPKEVGSDH